MFVPCLFWKVNNWIQFVPPVPELFACRSFLISKFSYKLGDVVYNIVGLSIKTSTKFNWSQIQLKRIAQWGLELKKMCTRWLQNWEYYNKFMIMLQIHFSFNSFNSSYFSFLFPIYSYLFYERKWMKAHAKKVIALKFKLNKNPGKNI